MFLKKKSNIIFRDYGWFGYITDNRSFGYRKANDDGKYIGDKILSDCGSVFFSVLTHKPQSLDVLAEKINKKFIGVDINIIKKDAYELYSILECDGFLVSGESIQGCEEKDKAFSYDLSKPIVENNLTVAVGINAERSTQEFFEEHFGGEPYLTSVHIEITGKCNERCIHCYISHENKTRNMSAEMFYEIIEQCKNLKVLHLTLSGGEPMLHKNFYDFLVKCREYEFSVNILSNLTLLTDEIIAEMKANPLLGVQVSLYSMEPNIHDEITQSKGSFEKTKNAILKLIANDIPIQISCPIMQKNKECYSEVVSWADEHKIHAGDDYVIIGEYDHTKSNLKCRLSTNEIKEIINNKVENGEAYFTKMKEDVETKEKLTESDYVCSVCNSSICIAENGNVYPCAGWQDYVVGNMNSSSLQDIWISSEKVRYLRGLRRSDFPKCLQCAAQEFCTMCMVRNANESISGNPLEVNQYFCEIAKCHKDMFFKRKDKLII